MEMKERSVPGHTYEKQTLQQTYQQFGNRNSFKTIEYKNSTFDKDSLITHSTTAVSEIVLCFHSAFFDDHKIQNTIL